MPSITRSMQPLWKEEGRRSRKRRRSRNPMKLHARTCKNHPKKNKKTNPKNKNENGLPMEKSRISDLTQVKKGGCESTRPTDDGGSKR